MSESNASETILFIWAFVAFEIRPLLSKLSVLFSLGQLDWGKERKEKGPFDFELFQHEILGELHSFPISLCVVH